jgi:hypothetical protein
VTVRDPSRRRIHRSEDASALEATVVREIGPRRALIPTAQAVEALRRVGFRDYPRAVLHGSTEHFNVYYSPPLGSVGQQIASAVVGVCERDYARISRIFGGITPAGLPLNIVLARLPQAGAYHYGSAAATLYCGVRTAPSVTPAFSSFLALTQLVDVFEASHARGWNSGASNGEGLSRVLAAERYPAQIAGFSTAAAWLNHGRPDFVNRTDHSDSNPLSIGCDVLFLNYLRHQLGYRWRHIVAAAGRNLSITYLRLTGDPSNPFPPFAALLASRFPVGRQAVLATDNPFPIPGGRLARGRQRRQGAGLGRQAETQGQGVQAPEPPPSEQSEIELTIPAKPADDPALGTSPGSAGPAGGEDTDVALADMLVEPEGDVGESPMLDEPNEEPPGSADEWGEPVIPDRPGADTYIGRDDAGPDVPGRTRGGFVGNKRTRIFHAATGAHLPSEGNRVYFDSTDEAIAAGFRRAEREGKEKTGNEQHHRRD